MKIRLFLQITFSLLLSALLIPQAALCLEISLKEKVEINEETVRLGDIAVITPEGKEAEVWAARQITRSPTPGSEKLLQSQALINSLSRIEGAEQIRWSGAQTIVIHRRGMEITRDRLKNILAEFLQENLEKLPRADIRLTSVRAPEKLILPVGDLSWTVTPSKPEIIGSSSFTIKFSIDGKPVKSCTVRGRLEVLSEVAVAAVTIRRGALITPDLLELKRRDISRLEAPFSDTRLAAGLIAKRTIRVGSPLDRNNTTEAPVILKGEPVRISAARGGLRISTRGVAVMNGRMGEYIRVKNISSNKLVYCRVDGPGLVSVEF